MSRPELVTVADQRLEAQQIEVPQPRGTIVLLHEALGSVSHWRDFPARLAEQSRYNVLLYSRAGHGQSEGWPGERSRLHYEQQALATLPALLRHFSIDRPVLLGHSEGAAIALIYAAQHAAAQHPAAQHPAAVRALVLESPILVAEPASATGMQMAERAWRETDLRERLSRHHRDADAVFAAWLSIRDADTLLPSPLEQFWPQIRVPVLLLQGGRDEYATSLQVEALRPLAPRMQLLLLPESGHTPHREQAEVVLNTIAGFLTGLDEAR